MTAPGEYLLPPPPGAPDRVAPVSLYRSTWLTGSVQGLKKRGLYDRYVAAMSPAERDALLVAAPPSWVAAALVERHYEVCDRLALSTEAMLEMGNDVTQRVHAASTAMGQTVIEAAGVTPWSILARFDKLLARSVVGGAVAVAKLGPKEGRIEIYGFPLARIRYNRVATRGILQGLVSIFCRTSWVHEVGTMCNATTLAYKLQWA